MLKEKTKQRMEMESIQSRQQKKSSRSRSNSKPKVSKKPEFEKPLITDFPLKHYSYSTFSKFGANPFMFKVNAINGDVIETTSSPNSSIGTALHKGMQAYLGWVPDLVTPADEGEAIKFGYEYGLKYLNELPDSFVKWNDKIPGMTKVIEIYSLVYFGYIQELNLKSRAKEVLMAEKMLKHQIEQQGQYLPIPLKGSADLVYRDKKKRIVIYDYKVVQSYSKDDEVDGQKLLQGGFLYFLHRHELKENPYSIIFGEYKTSKNQDGSPQLREYEFVFEESPIMFDLFYRYYHDVTQALLGKQVYVPNLQAMYDKEVSILAYVNYLDVDEERERLFKKSRVHNITDFLKKKIQKDGTMKKYTETVTKQFISSDTLNYKNMEIHDRIKMKLAEHGVAVEFDSKVVGSSVTLYRFEPSIGVKMTKIDSFARDIEQAVGVAGIRILAPIPGSELVGFEIPLRDRTFPDVKPVADEYKLNMGIDIIGQPVWMDFRESPHMIVAGATGSGKSVFLNSIIYQFKDMKNVEVILMDPKRVELAEWRDIKNLKEYADNPEDINTILTELVVEMNRRYDILQAQKLKNTHGTNIPYIVVILDEFGDLVASSDYGPEIRKNILILAQKSRAAGIHLILATQRPSVKVIDGDIKMNFPVRVAFRVATGTDSKVIIDEQGAEKLLGKGDMLLKKLDGVVRLQGYSV